MSCIKAFDEYVYGESAATSEEAMHNVNVNVNMGAYVTANISVSTCITVVIITIPIIVKQVLCDQTVILCSQISNIVMVTSNIKHLCQTSLSNNLSIPKFPHKDQMFIVLKFSQSYQYGI